MEGERERHDGKAETQDATAEILRPFKARPQDDNVQVALVSVEVGVNPRHWNRRVRHPS